MTYWGSSPADNYPETLPWWALRWVGISEGSAEFDSDEWWEAWQPEAIDHDQFVEAWALAWPAPQTTTGRAQSWLRKVMDWLNL